MVGFALHRASKNLVGPGHLRTSARHGLPMKMRTELRILNVIGKAVCQGSLSSQKQFIAQ